MSVSLSDDVAQYHAARAAEYDITAGYSDRSGEARRLSIKARFQNTLRGLDVLEIGCGTGYWTAVIANAARSVVAIDLDPGMVLAARRRLSGAGNVRCLVADAYSLERVAGPFNAVFAHWWWSHIPKSRIRPFLMSLHTHLIPGALVLFVDQLRYASVSRRQDAGGNFVEQRRLRNNAVFEIVKNFPSEPEIRHLLRGLAHRVVYRESPVEHQWAISYRTT